MLRYLADEPIYPIGYVQFKIPKYKCSKVEVAEKNNIKFKLLKQHYNDALNYGRKARWIVTSNFREFKIYDMETQAAPLSILLEELPEKFHAFDFLIKKTRRNYLVEDELTVEVTNAIEKLYDTLRSYYQDKNSLETFESLNKLCVRLVFCLYAESANIFPEFKMFSDYLKNYDSEKISFRRALIDIFKVLNTPENLRDPYIDDALKKFPYIDGGLFDDDNFNFPEFKTAAREIFFNDLANKKWKKIDPTIFGAVFEATLDPANFSKPGADKNKSIRRESGIHYTSPGNITKVIEPLFYNDLYEKLVAATSRQDLLNLQEEIANIKILDPACGSGNFLTESYILLRELENAVLEVLHSDGYELPADPIKISIENFFGIEIKDFAVAVAKTALWISEIKMRQKLNDALNLNLQHFPLKKIPHIICANALTFDWSELVNPADLNFIAGNPPFIGTKGQTPAQKADILALCPALKPLDYVTAWFKKASDFIQGTNIRCAFVATNSITQGEQVAPLWQNLNVHIDFAYKTFKWFSKSPKSMAQVHVVIIGFSQVEGLQKNIYTVAFEENDEGKKVEKIESTPAKNINGYLIDAPNIYIEKRAEPLCNVPIMIKGSIIIDGGNLIISAEEYEPFIKKEPLAKKYIRQYMGSDDFINNKIRYCLWLADCPPYELRKMKTVYQKVNAVKAFRLKSKRPGTLKAAETPSLFAENRQPDSDYIAVPVTSSENRRYVPTGFIEKKVIANGDILTIPNAGLYEFGVLNSVVHNAWLRAVCGRLKSDYRYSASIVYNNFVWCEPTAEQRAKIENTAQKILDVRAGYPNSSLADLYDENAMPADLRAAHLENDLAVMAAYGFSAAMTEAQIVSALMEKYLQLTK